VFFLILAFSAVSDRFLTLQAFEKISIGIIEIAGPSSFRRNRPFFDRPRAERRF
jgi:hypothetical protein